MNNKTTTTDLETLRRFPRRFTWGEVVGIHDVGALNDISLTYRYSIVEAAPRAEKNETRSTFHVYVDGLDQRISFYTFEEALVTAIAIRMNPRAGSSAWDCGRFAMKILTPVKE